MYANEKKESFLLLEFGHKFLCMTFATFLICEEVPLVAPCLVMAAKSPMVSVQQRHKIKEKCILIWARSNIVSKRHAQDHNASALLFLNRRPKKRISSRGNDSLHAP